MPNLKQSQLDPCPEPKIQGGKNHERKKKRTQKETKKIDKRKLINKFRQQFCSQNVLKFYSFRGSAFRTPTRPRPEMSQPLDPML